MRYLIDTTLLIDHALGREAAVELVSWLFSEPNELLICDVRVTEALSRGTDEELAELRALIEPLEYVVTGPDAAAWAGETRRRLLRTNPRTLGDALIGGVAWSVGATVVTRNPRDFEVQGVPVLAYL